jgi:hypothetical protein
MIFYIIVSINVLFLVISFGYYGSKFLKERLGSTAIYRKLSILFPDKGEEEEAPEKPESSMKQSLPTTTGQ